MTATQRVVRALAALVFACAVLPVLAEPAQACSCGGLRMEEELARGSAVAIVTRTDTTAGQAATFRVERSYGADLPETLTGGVDGGMGCEPQVFPQELTALVFRREGGWVLPSCSELDLSDVLDRFEGQPKAVSSGPAVVLATGNFGTSGFVALDRFGQAVAWGRPGVPAPAEATLCPEGKRFVTFGPAAQGGLEFAVYDTADMRLRRTVSMEATSEYETRALRCLDPAGKSLEMQLGEDGDDRWSQLTAQSSRITKKAIAIEDVYVTGTTRVLEGSRVIEVDSDDPRAKSELGEPPNVVRNFVVAKDGRTAAAITAGSYDAESNPKGDAQLLIFDQKTGEVHARWPVESYVNQLAWAASGNLVARIGYGSGYGAAYRAGELIRFDRELRVLSRRPGSPGGSMTVIGESAVFWGGARLTASTEENATLVVDNLRLVATYRLLPLSDAGFASGPPRVAKSEPSAEAGRSTDGAVGGVLVGLGLVAVGVMVLGMRWRRELRARR